MSIPVNFNESSLSALALAKVGNPLRNEPLLTSKALCHFDEDEANLLTGCFLKSFKSLELHHLKGNRGPESNPLFEYAGAVFNSPEQLLTASTEIAKHLYAKSHHPNIKNGDLCISLIEGIIIEGTATQGLCIIKSENKVPFLQISELNGDLTLTTQHGIYPDKIDKGCLVVNHRKNNGFVVYLFDKSGNTHFWKRDFAGAAPVRDEDYLTRRFGELCVDFAHRGLPEEINEEHRMAVAGRALNYLNESKQFDLSDFERTLDDPELIEQFTLFRKNYQEETGNTLEDRFTVSGPEARKAKKRLTGRLRLDTGAELRFSSAFIDQAEKLLERGYDEQKEMHYLKIYFDHQLQ
ncbi:MAG: nucleoid-associated protein [Verrucomicrobiales bacterium]